MTTTARDEELCRNATEKRLRLNFLQMTPARRQEARARAQARINEELERGRATPSPLAVQFGRGLYDEPRRGELEKLEAWAHGVWVG